ncbi:hypothetical protein, partial [Parasphingorhabdus sp.]|uniref:hypothetical protein n=1 Tax=Parasphingorhabdus sp. TaxID=2709688 RepID=UPI003298627A
HVPGNQDARLTRPGMREAGAYAAAKAHAPGNALYRGAHGNEVIARKVDHPVDRSRIMGRTLAFDPRAETGAHGVGVERQGVEVHGGSPQLGK